MDCLLYGTSIWDLSLTWEGSFSTVSFFLNVWDVWMCCCHQLTLIRVFAMLSSSILCLVQLGGRHFLYCAWVSDTLIVSFLTSACPDRHIHCFWSPWLNYCHFASAVLMARMERLCNNDVLECEGERFFLSAWTIVYQSMTKDFYCVRRTSTSLRDFRCIRDKKNACFCVKIVIEIAQIIYMWVPFCISRIARIKSDLRFDVYQISDGVLNLNLWIANPNNSANQN